MLRPGGTITLIEGDHRSAYFHPAIAAAHAAIRCRIELLRAAGGNSLIEGVRESAIAAGIASPESFDAGVRDLHRTTEQDGEFCYTFFKGVDSKA